MALSYASVDLCLVVVILALNIVPGSRALNAEDFNTSSATTWSNQEITFNAIYGLLNSTNYSNHVLPHHASHAAALATNAITQITPKAFILRVGDISMDNVFNVDFYFTQLWVDPRLDGLLHNVSKFRLRREMINKLWLPDTIIRNSQESTYPDYSKQDNDEVVILRPGGVIEYTSRVSSVCFCSLDLHWYPFDEQHCKVEFEFMSYGVSEVVYNESKRFPCVSLAPGATLPTQYVLLKDTINRCKVQNLTYGRGGIGGYDVANYTEKYSSFHIHLHYKRHSSPTVIRSLFPAALIAFSAYLSLYINIDPPQARVVLTITCFLLTITLTVVNRQTNSINYLTAADYYVVGCIVFIFSCLVELVVAHRCFYWKHGKNYVWAKSKKLWASSQRAQISCRSTTTNIELEEMNRERHTSDAAYEVVDVNATANILEPPESEETRTAGKETSGSSSCEKTNSFESENALNSKFVNKARHADEIIRVILFAFFVSLNVIYVIVVTT